MYAALSKLLDFSHFITQIKIQALPDLAKPLLPVAIPVAEITAAILLLFNNTQRAGLWMSIILMLLFTGYIVLVLMNVFGRIPCSCGGILEQMSWTTHLFFNLIIDLMTITAITISQKKGGVVNGSLA
jgi:putative oxidoreductase